MPADRLLPTDEAADLLDLVREICAEQLAPRAAAAEAAGEFPRDVFALLGKAGLLGAALPRGARRRAASPTRSTCRCVEEIATAWAERRRSASRVHALTCYRLVAASAPTSSGRRWLPRMLGGDCSAPTACPSRRPAPTSARSRTRAAPRRRRLRRRTAPSSGSATAAHADYYIALRPHLRRPEQRPLRFLVPADTAGMTLRRAREEDGPAACDHAPR